MVRYTINTEDVTPLIEDVNGEYVKYSDVEQIFNIIKSTATTQIDALKNYMDTVTLE